MSVSRGVAFVVSGAAVVAACSFGPREVRRVERTTEVRITVVSETGGPVADAEFRFGTRSARGGDDGVIEIDIAQSVAGVVDAAGALPEPLVVAPGDGDVRVRLFDRVGPNGIRLAFHFGGDVMLGRRYQANPRATTALAIDADGARAVVDDIAPLTSVADLTVVNLETVVGLLPDREALAGKRFLIQSPPQILDALREMGVDAVALGNNHANDWGDLGVLSTLSALGPTGIGYAGAGVSTEDAVRGVSLSVGAGTVGIVSATTVNGDFVNDELPDQTEAPPTDLAATDLWQYEYREFGFGEVGDAAYIPSEPRRAGSAWREFRALEPTLGPTETAELWEALTAPLAFPEIQDWVARRGHGGAAQYDGGAIADEVRRLRAEGARSVIVQFHAGFQFSERPSANLRSMSREAIDSGADMVISHHPHVMQGLEWYRGKLIAYSLGNLVFDQDFHITYPTAVLRVVVDDSGILEARLVPAMLVDYRPVPVAGTAAARVVRMVDARSMLPGVSERIEGLDVGVTLEPDDDPNAQPASVVFDRNTGLVLPSGQRDERVELVSLIAGEPFAIAACDTVLSQSIPDGVEYGVDLFGWGAIDDVTADGERSTPMHWVVRSRDDGAPLSQGALEGHTDDALRFVAGANLDAWARFVSRVPIEPRRWYTAGGESVDGEPRYVLELDVRRSEGADVVAELGLFKVLDDDPNSDPLSRPVRTVSVPIPVAVADKWTHVEMPLDPATFDPAPDGSTADAMMVRFVAAPAVRQVVSIDNVRVMEWRAPPSSHEPIWLEVDALRSDTDRDVELTLAGCPAG